MYYGAHNKDIKVKNKIYNKIESLDDLYFALLKCWDINTCTERLRYKWTSKNPSVGQCAITAFIVQDIFGGDIYEMKLDNGSIHCYNVIDNIPIDLANEQFEDKAKDLVYENNSIQNRRERMSLESKRNRYNLLKQKLNTLLN